MKENMQTELHAAETILDRGIKVKPLAPFFLRIIGIKRITLRLKKPYGGTLHRVAEYYLKTGISAEQLDNIRAEDALLIMVMHGSNIRKAVACSILNGWISGYLFTKPLAFYLKWALSNHTICALMDTLIKFGGLSDFMTTTRYIRSLRLTAPTLGQKAKRS